MRKEVPPTKTVYRRAALPPPRRRRDTLPVRAVGFVRRNAVQTMAALVLAGCLVLSLLWQWQLTGWYPGWSLRYETPISGAQAAASRQYAVDRAREANENDNADKANAALWPTFWGEYTLPLESDLTEAPARCVLYSGEGALVWPARFTRGGWPGATDEAGCAVSEALAWRLWGSYDVVGSILTIDGRPYTVRGVFEGEKELCLAACGDEGAPEGWQAAELRGAHGLYESDVTAFAQSSGLGTPDTLVDGEGLKTLAGALCWLPAALLLAVLLAKWAAYCLKIKPALVRWGAAGLLVVLVACLPLLLGLLPPWLVPPKWSDFSFWGGLLGQVEEAVTGFLALAPALRDVAGKKALLAAGGVTLLGLSPVAVLAVKISPGVVPRKPQT